MKKKTRLTRRERLAAERAALSTTGHTRDDADATRAAPARLASAPGADDGGGEGLLSLQALALALLTAASYLPVLGPDSSGTT